VSSAAHPKRTNARHGCFIKGGVIFRLRARTFAAASEQAKTPGFALLASWRSCSLFAIRLFALQQHFGRPDGAIANQGCSIQVKW